MENKENLDPRNSRTEAPEGEEPRASDKRADLTQSEITESAESPEKSTEEPATVAKPLEDPEPATDEKPQEVQEPAAGEKPQSAEEPAAEEKPRTDPDQPAEENPTEAKSESVETPAGEKSATGETEDDNDTLAARYNAMDRSALVDVIEELVQSEDIIHIRRHIGFVKAAYRKQLREENIAAYEQEMDKDVAEEGATEKQTDPLTERFDAAFSVYKEKKAVHDQELEKDMQKNLQVKENILDELRTLIDSEEELKKTYDQFHALQDRWRSVGQVPRSAKGTLWNNYHFLVEKFFDKVNINKELKDLDLKKNLEVKTGLCEKAEELLLESSITRSFQQLQKLHDAWKETGPVPKDKKDEIWERFKAATDKLNKRRQEHY